MKVACRTAVLAALATASVLAGCKSTGRKQNDSDILGGGSATELHGFRQTDVIAVTLQELKDLRGIVFERARIAQINKGYLALLRV